MTTAAAPDLGIAVPAFAVHTDGRETERQAGRDLLRILAAHADWMRMRGRAAGTIYQRRRTILRLAGSLPVPLLEATAADLLAWRSALTVADPSVRTAVAHVRDFYAWLALEGYRLDNPAARIPVPRRERSLPRPIGEDELFRALRYAPRRVRPWLVLAGWCGLRAREIAWLRRDAVLDRAPAPVIYVRADSAKGGHERIVPMPPFVTGELRPLLPSSGFVFPRGDGQPGPNAPWTVSQLSAEAIRRSGTDATLHQLRHRYATMMDEASGHDLRLVQEVLGHQNLETTAIYTLFRPAAATAAAALLPVPGGRRLRAVGDIR